jgi:CheY-like chemotaxis protein
MQVYMDTSERLEGQLQDALANLHNPDYQPPELLCAVMGCDPKNGPVPVQSAIIQEIKGLEPEPGVPPDAHVRRVYEVIYHRYVLKLTQEKTAELLDLSVRHLNRVQRKAVHTLARILWERSRTLASSPSDRAKRTRMRPQRVKAARVQAPDWRSQAEREIASLQASAPDAVCDVREVIDSVLELASTLVTKHGVHVEVGFVQPDLTAAIHFSILRQVLITALGRLARYASSGPITVFAGLEDANIKITITGSLAAENRPTESDLVRDILVSKDVSVEVHIDGDHVFLWIKAPSTGTITVLAVDDNPDMVYFYRRSTVGTRYRVVHATQGQDVFDTIEAVLPNVIVLDVMLPDIDGWKLLMFLHENPATKSIPVIVCTVVREEELALSLGASLYLSKPVRPRQFIQALDQVLPQASAGATTSPKNSVATY